MTKQVTSQKHKLLSKLRQDWLLRSIIAIATRRSLSTAVAAVMVGAGLAAIPSLPAFADTDYHVCDYENTEKCVTDAGLHNVEYVTASTNTQIGWSPEGTYDGHEVYELKINDGTDCLTLNTSDDTLIYDEGCSDASNQLFYRTQPSGTGNDLYYIQNEYFNAGHSCTGVMSSQRGFGTDLSMGCTTGLNIYDEWGLFSV